ncbi:hypothetical protein KW783_03795 [Candidatus Parcubacteria bacterium]|nr:hypothetical protein [Candidatus Parcubacteria bacterium]
MRKIFFYPIIVIAALILFPQTPKVHEAEAQSVTPNAFGGIVLTSLPCTCSGGFLLTIGPPKGGQFVYQIGAPQFANFQLPRPGVWALGLYSPGAICTIVVPGGCSPLGVPIGTITPVVGTSL